MATANDDIFDDFLQNRGHDTESPSWKEDYNKKRCPECEGVHEMSATSCDVCGWEP